MCELGTDHLTWREELWFFVSFRIFFRTTQVRIFFLSWKARFFFPKFNIRLYDKNSQSYYFFFLHQNQNIFFSNIGNQNNFLEKNLQVKWSFPKYNYTLHGHILEYDTSAKYLGCTISSDLKWGKHISTICSKANNTISFLKRNIRERPFNLKGGGVMFFFILSLHLVNVISS